VIADRKGNPAGGRYGEEKKGKDGCEAAKEIRAYAQAQGQGQAPRGKKGRPQGQDETAQAEDAGKTSRPACNRAQADDVAGTGGDADRAAANLVSVINPGRRAACRHHRLALTPPCAS
jgi:hypothetical protein